VNAFKRFLAAVFCLWVAAGCQQTVAPKVAIAGTTPDLMLVVVGCLALFGNRMSGAFLGFGAGVLQGALAGANLGAYAVSRTISGFLAGWFTALEFESNAAVAFFSVAIATLLGQLLLMFGAPPSQIPGFLLATIGAAMYNGVLAMPLFVLLKRVIDPVSK
jgi:rod shape-determining protein MreD